MDEVAALRGPNNLSYRELALLGDSFPPLFPVLSKLWMGILPGDTSLRVFAALVGVLATACVLAIGRTIGGRSVGYAAGVWAGCSAFFVYYSQEGRGYAFYLFLAAAALLFLCRGLRSSRDRDWVLFGLFSCLGLLTHYYFALLVTASALVVLLRRKEIQSLRVALGAFAAVGITALLLLPFLRADLAFQVGIRAPRPMNASAIGYTLFSFLSGFSLGPSRTELAQLSAVEAARQVLPWVLVLAPPLMWLTGRGLRRLHHERWLGPIVLLMTVPFVLAGVMGVLLDVTYNPRFLLWCAIPLAVTVAAGVPNTGMFRYASNPFGQRLAYGALAILLITQMFALHNRHTLARYQNEDVRGAMAFVEQHSSGGPSVFVVSDYMTSPLGYYASSRTSLVELPEPGVFSNVVRSDADVDLALQTIRSNTNGESPFWLVYSRPFHGDPEGMLLQALEERTGLKHEGSFSGVDVYLGSLPSAGVN